MQRRRRDCTSGGRAGTSGGRAAAPASSKRSSWPSASTTSSALLLRLAGEAVDPENHPRAFTLELDRLGSGLVDLVLASRRPSTQPIGVVSSAVRAGSIEPETISRSIARVIAT